MVDMVSPQAVAQCPPTFVVFVNSLKKSGYFLPSGFEYKEASSGTATRRAAILMRILEKRMKPGKMCAF